MEEKTQDGSEVVVGGDSRSNDYDKDESIDYAYDGDNNNSNKNNNSSSSSNIRTRIDGDQISKKLRRRDSNDEIPVRNGVGESSPSSPPRRWWFSRQQDSSTFIGNPTSSGMVLSEHLGSTSDVVESLTHDIKNWSLTRLSSPMSNAKNGSCDCAASVLQKTKRMEKEQRCKDAKRQVRLAQRRFLQEQKQLLSRCPASPCS